MIPQPLRIWLGGLNKTALSGCWSRRINQEHRLVYRVFPDKIRILSAASTIEKLRLDRGYTCGAEGLSKTAKPTLQKGSFL